MSDVSSSPFSAGEAAAAFIACQLSRPSFAGLEGQRIVLLGSFPRRLTGGGALFASAAGADELVRLCTGLLRCGADLVMLDCPRSRLLIETLLPLAADWRGRWQGGCHLEPDLSSACREAMALLLLPGWRLPHSLPWRALAGRLRPQAQLFDLRPWDGLQQLEFSGVQVWRLGGCAPWG